MRRLVILGGGYGGLRILQRLLSSYLPIDLEIILVDREPFHCMKTEYYALAAGTISDQDVRVAYPQHPKFSFVFGEVTNIDLENNQIEIKDRDEPLAYDELVIGLGSEDKYHDVPGADEFTLSIQSIDGARQTSQVLSNLPPNGIVAIVGGGLSGVEMASELRESRPDLTIQLYDRGKRILSDFSERLSSYVEKWFIEHDVKIINESNITKVKKNKLYNNGEPIEVDAIVWTAGIQPHHLVRELQVEKDRYHRIVLSPHHYIPAYPNVYVVGDCASLPHSPSAQLAEEQAEQIVSVMIKRWNGEELAELPPIKLKGVLGSLGTKSGFGVMGGTSLTGRVARLLKSGVLWLYKRSNV
ncbi:FAD-dependent oxidoreductase [Pueribacillus theae]|uniref:FAD-dependent oxidoreductase n=1 Tax=Pueribacillus theae TaxID=2171751 RepID=A0A2U1K3A7_9BACI|nr:NAD(P)/FAD-dependent oxidoreductase [Pueribacillus theae]PWA11991.1 FAD-dependent oxidoreductase [Pueribacillus theae]